MTDRRCIGLLLTALVVMAGSAGAGHAADGTPPTVQITDAIDGHRTVRTTTIPEALAAAQTQEQAGRLNEAIAIYDAVLTAAPENTEAQLGRGTSLGAAHRVEEAANSFKTVIQRDPGNARAHLLLGDLYLFHQQAYDQALDEFSQAALTGDQRTQALALEQAGDIYMMIKHDWAQAGAYYRRVLATWPNHIKTHYNLGGCLANQRRFDEAIAEMELVIKLAPKAEEPELATRAREAIAAIREQQSARPTAAATNSSASTTP